MIIFVLAACSYPMRLVTESAYGWLKLVATALCRLAGSRARLRREERSRRSWGDLTENVGQYVPNRGQNSWRRCPREARGPCPGGVGPPSCPVRLVGPRTRAVASKLAQLSLAKRSRSWPGTRVGNPPDLSRTSPPRRAPKNRGRVGVESGRLAVKHQSANLTDGARDYSPNIPINSWRSARCTALGRSLLSHHSLDRG